MMCLKIPYEELQAMIFRQYLPAKPTKFGIKTAIAMSSKYILEK